MFYANDKNNNRINILNALQSEQYFCPICNQELQQRRGMKNVHHFAHKKNSYELCDSWYFDMSEWHRDWQNMFPEDCREVVVEYDGKKHRADVLINGTVIEFQHSKISYEEFNERNIFYTAAGYNIIWLFDMTEDCKKEHIVSDWRGDFSYDWKYHWHLFDGFDPEKQKNIYVCFELIHDDESDETVIKHLSWLSEEKNSFTTEKNVVFNRNSFVDFVSNYIYVDIYEDINEEVDEPGRTIYEIIHNCDSVVIGVRNITTGVRAKIGNLEYLRTHFFNKIYGYLGLPDGCYGYYDDKREIYYWRRPEWIVEWRH